MGIIPAYAGNTSASRCVPWSTWDHPRVCGEHAFRHCHINRVSGIIPAYAGNTNSPTRNWPPRKDHPRVCGEHSVESGVWPLSLGSSPRMRGTPSYRKAHARSAGIIPAYAGNTVQCLVFFTHVRDHPRVCGEHRAEITKLRTSAGSSPRMRGTPSPRLFHDGDTGIIPAYAGNT